MKMIENIKLKFEDRRLRKVENMLIKIHRRNNLAFNPLQVGMTTNLIGDKPFSARLLENFVWYSASIPLLRSYYYKSNLKDIFGNDEPNFFWKKAKEKSRKVHSKLPSVISDRMVDLLINAGVNFDIEINNGEKINESETSNVKNVLNKIHDENKIYTILGEAISNQSWSGGVAYKIVFDSDVSKLPILQFEDPRNFELITKYKRLTAITFKYWYEKGNSKNKIKYLHHETYTTNDDGKAVIIHELFKIQSDKMVPVNLKEIPETAELDPMKTYESIDCILAGYIPNRTPNKEFLGTPYGESDYAGNYSLFDSADELLSTMVEELRKGKIKTFIPESLIPKDKNGTILEVDDFDVDFVKVEDKDDPNENEIKEFVPTLRTRDYIEEWKSLLTMICNNVGLSPLTLGVTGLEAISASDTSQREREKVSLRTRKNKLKIWKEALEDIALKELLAYREMRLNKINYPGLDNINIDKSNLNIKVSFGDYLGIPIEERINLYGTAHMNGSISTEEMVEQIYRDEKTEKQKKEEVNRLKMEKGMSLDNISNELIL